MERILNYYEDNGSVKVADLKEKDWFINYLDSGNYELWRILNIKGNEILMYSPTSDWYMLITKDCNFGQALVKPINPDNIKIEVTVKETPNDNENN